MHAGAHAGRPDTLAALAQVTGWRAQGDTVVLIGADDVEDSARAITSAHLKKARPRRPRPLLFCAA